MGVIVYSPQLRGILENEGPFSAPRKECFKNTSLRVAMENGLVEQVGSSKFDGSSQFRVTEKGKTILKDGIERTPEIDFMLLGD